MLLGTGYLVIDSGRAKLDFNLLIPCTSQERQIKLPSEQIGHSMIRTRPFKQLTEYLVVKTQLGHPQQALAVAWRSTTGGD